MQVCISGSPLLYEATELLSTLILSLSLSHGDYQVRFCLRTYCASVSSSLVSFFCKLFRRCKSLTPLSENKLNVLLFRRIS